MAQTKRKPLSRERVLDTALLLADSHGLEKVTMRAVAEQLGVEAMSLYRHVANKGEILDGLIERVVEEMGFPDPHMPWREALRSRAHSARAVLLRHRWAAMLLESRPTPGPSRMRLHERVLTHLCEAGFSTELAFLVFLTLDSFIYGFTMQEIWSPFAAETRVESIAAYAPVLTGFPQLTQVMKFLSSPQRARAHGAAQPAADFEFGLELLLDGFERARLNPRPAKRGQKAGKKYVKQRG